MPLAPPADTLSAIPRGSSDFGCNLILMQIFDFSRQFFQKCSLVLQYLLQTCWSHLLAGYVMKSGMSDLRFFDLLYLNWMENPKKLVRVFRVKRSRVFLFFWVAWFFFKINYISHWKQANTSFYRPKTIQVWAQRLINLEIPVLVRSLKSSNVELGQYLDGRLFKCCLSAAVNP